MLLSLMLDAGVNVIDSIALVYLVMNGGDLILNGTDWVIL
jgi:hypothetical protein